MRTAETRSCRLVLDEDGVLRATMTVRMHTLDEAHENLEMVARLAGGRRVALLLDIRATTDISSEVQHFYASGREMKGVSAIALVTDSVVGRLLGNLSIAIHSLVGNRFPVRLFSREDDALAWAHAHAGAPPGNEP